jgi:hypothetical protein
MNPALATGLERREVGGVDEGARGVVVDVGVARDGALGFGEGALPAVVEAQRGLHHHREGGARGGDVGDDKSRLERRIAQEFHPIATLPQGRRAGRGQLLVLLVVLGATGQAGAAQPPVSPQAVEPVLLDVLLDVSLAAEAFLLEPPEYRSPYQPPPLRMKLPL